MASGRDRPRKSAPRRDARRKDKGASALALITSGMVTAILIALGLAVAVVFETQRAGPAATETVFVTPRGAGAAQIGRDLESKGLIRSALVFRAAEQLYARGRKPQAGEYRIPAGASPRQILELLIGGRVVQESLTIPEGWTSRMVWQTLKDDARLTGALPDQPPPEGSLLPQTYVFASGTERAALLKQMQDAQARVLNEAWAARNVAAAAVRTPQEAVTLASLVQKETGPGEEGRIAAVFTNRLKRTPPMRLESDPTIIYGVCLRLPERCRNGRLINERTQEPRGIRQSEIELDTGYNTYRIDGLPPGPIANPGEAAIRAVLNPPASAELFFVAKEHANPQAGHVFSATLEQHNAAVARLRQLEAAAGAR